MSYDADINGIHSVGEGLARIKTQLEAALEDLSRVVAKYNAENQGKAIESYGAAQALWNRGLGEFGIAVGQASSAAHSTASTYLTADSRGASRFSS